MRFFLPLLALLSLPAGVRAASGSTTPPAEAASTRVAAGEDAFAPLHLALSDLTQAPGMMDRRAPSTQGQGLSDRPTWHPGQTLMQGFLGASEFQTMERTGGSLPPLDGSDDSLAQLPGIGGGGQWKLGGERLDFGLELMIAFAWRANAAAFATSGGGAVVAVDVDLFLIDLYGGPFVSVFLGKRLRAYGALGPMMQWGSVDEVASDDSYDNSSDGFGTGVYARAGLELRVRPGLMIGGGARWTDSSLDLGSGNGTLDIDGFQWALTVTTGI